MRVFEDTGVVTEPVEEWSALLGALNALRKGEASVRLPVHWTGIAGKVADAFNEVVEQKANMTLEVEGRPLEGEFMSTAKTINKMVEQLGNFSAEVTRVAREVGTEGKLGGQAKVKGVAGTWEDLTDSVNSMAGNLTDQVRNIAEVTTAVAKGDLSKKIEVDVKGEFLTLKNTIIRQKGPVSAFGLQLSQNTRDNNFSPAGGGLRSVSLEVGTSDTTTVGNTPGPLVPCRHNFTKVGVDLRQYISLQGPRKAGDYREPKKVFAVRLLLGVTNKDVPLFEQYFLGGPESLRSLQIDQYWGNKLALGQAEFRIPVGKDNNLQAVLFSDLGDAWGSIYQDNQLKQHNNFTLNSDVGVGVRLVTPVGPIRLDYAVGSGGGRTQFDIGQSF